MPNHKPEGAELVPDAMLGSVERGVTRRKVKLLATSLLAFVVSSAYAMPLRYSLEGLAR